MAEQIPITSIERGANDQQMAYAVVAGTTPDGLAFQRIIVEPDGTARLSDETVERIARRVAEIIRPLPFNSRVRPLPFDPSAE